MITWAAYQIAVIHYRRPAMAHRETMDSAENIYAMQLAR